VKEIVHCTGITAEPTDIKITNEWTLESNWFDLAALVSKGMLRPFVREFFGDEDVWKVYGDEAMDEMAEACNTEVDQIEAARASGAVLISAKAKAKAKARTRRANQPREEFTVPLEVHLSQSQPEPMEDSDGDEVAPGGGSSGDAGGPRQEPAATVAVLEALPPAPPPPASDAPDLVVDMGSH